MYRPLQIAAMEALKSDKEWHDANNEIYKRRRKIAENIMDLLDCKYDPKQAGMFLWGRIPDKYENVEDLTEKILHKAKVFITPGMIFGKNGERFIRISLCAPESKLEEAYNRIKEII